MSRSFLETLEREMRQARWYFWVLILVAILMLELADLLGWFPKSDRETYREIARDIRIALLVSFVIFVVEGRMRRLHLEQIQGNVLASVLKIAMPEELTNELLMIIKEKVFRANLRYTITFRRCDLALKDCQAQPPSDDYFILQREITFTLKNVTATAQPVKISSRSDWKYPFAARAADFRIDVDNHPVLLGGANQPPFARALVRRIEKLFRRGSTGTIEIKPESVELRHEVGVPGGGTREVYLKACEVLRLDERNYTMVFLSPSVNLEVVFINQHKRISSSSITADLNHRDGAKLIPQHTSTYTFPGGILPGQSIEVSWTPIPEPATAA